MVSINQNGERNSDKIGILRVFLFSLIYLNKKKKKNNFLHECKWHLPCVEHSCQIIKHQIVGCLINSSEDSTHLSARIFDFPL